MIDRDALKQQQAVLKHLGYYTGAIDGYWSTKTMEAKIEFERSGKFNPCISNRGMPFNLNSKLPKGLFVNEEGLLSVVGENVRVEDVVAIAPQAVTAPVVNDRNLNHNSGNQNNGKNSGNKQHPHPQKPPQPPIAIDVAVKL